MSTLITLALVSLFSTIQTTVGAQGPTECHDPAMTSWMLNSEGENPCLVVQDLMRVCNPSFNINWLSPSYSCDNGPGSMEAACCCGSPTFALLSACWSCQYNYTMDIVTTTFTSFEKDCSSVPTPLTSYDPIISSKVAQIDIPLWAKIEPAAGKWDITAAWRNVTPIATVIPPVPTQYPAVSSSNSGLSSAAIIGVIVGSVFGTALMFIFAAVILWRCLGLGRYRTEPDHDIRVGQDMGYLDGEYVYVQPVNPEQGPVLARRFTLRRDTRPRLEIDLDASDYSRSNSRNPSDFEDDTSRPLRQYTRSPSYLGPDRASHRDQDGRSYLDTEPPSPYSPARHASLDGKYRGYHPGASPQSVRHGSLELVGHDERDSYPPSTNRSPVRRSRDRPVSGQFSTTRRPISGQFSAHRMSGSHRASGHYSAHHRPSGQYTHRASGSGQFRTSNSPYRTSAERRRDHRASVRSGLRPASFDSGDGGGRFMRIEDQRPSLDGARFGREKRFSREVGAGFSRDEGPRYSREEGPRYSRDGRPRFSREEERYGRDDGPRYSRDDGPRFSQDGGRRSRGGGRFSRDEYRKPSLSEGDEDLADADTGEGNYRTTGSDFNAHMGHLRKRSQSARTSYEPGQDLGLGLEVEEARDLPVPASAPPTMGGDSSSRSAGGLSKVRSMRVANPEAEREETLSRPASVIREPGLLARARTLMQGATPKSSRSGMSSAYGHTQAQASTSGAPPSAWQRLRNIPSALSLSAHRSSTDSDATSAYHTAQGHQTPLATGSGAGGAGTPTNEFGVMQGQRTVSRAGSALGQVPLSEHRGGAEEGDVGYHQETDAGVQLVVETSGTTTPGDIGHEPPAYAPEPEAGPSEPAVRPRLVQFDSSSISHSDFDNSSAGGYPIRDSGNWDSTASSAMIQTWTAARRPTGFVGTGRVVASVRETGAEQEVMWNSGEGVSSRSAVVTLAQEERLRSGPGGQDGRE